MSVLRSNRSSRWNTTWTATSPSSPCATTTAPSGSTSRSRNDSSKTGSAVATSPSARLLVGVFLAGHEIREVSFQLFHGLLRSLLPQSKTSCLRFPAQLRQRLQHPL